MNWLCDQGAFLTTSADGRINTMTIAWGSAGIVMKKPTLTVFIRESRYTQELLSTSNEFTVSIPDSKNMFTKLLACGKQSGRDGDKIANNQLTLQSAKVVDTPIIAEGTWHLECKVLLAQPMTAPFIDEECQQEHWIEDNPYLCYIAEVVACYGK